ncbi:unnamed protein product [Phyllotreta striolata]|uniref:Pinin n=1 Tax=Phyllotreta striolata TaxID=444603 RepID=A0A9N9XQQ6_PHYSR|nr:unnamed protein product [Phyllotreta striolata]
MGTEILKSFGNLQSELDEARSSLKGVDESIKRLIGRDPSELPPRNAQKRSLEEKNRNSKVPARLRNSTFENDEPPVKRRSNISVFKRLSEKIPDDDHSISHKGLISKVIVTPKEVPSREQALEAQNKDEKFKARNKRMFGALLGTLQKFQQEETKLKQREQKRAELEKKIEEHEIKEKEEVRKERQELFFNRKKKQAEIKVIELKMLRMKEYASWEQTQTSRLNYILTKAKPHVHYLPRKMTEQTTKLLEESKSSIQEMLDIKKKQIAEELQHIDEKMKKNFDYKFGHKEEKEEVRQTDTRRRHDTDKDNENDDQYDEIQNDEVENKDGMEVETLNEDQKKDSNLNGSADNGESYPNGDSNVNQTNPTEDSSNNNPADRSSPVNTESNVNDAVNESHSEQNSQESPVYNSISVQMGNFGPQTSD